MTTIAQAGAQVQREGDRVWIRDVGRLQWGKGQENTFIAALTLAMRAVGEEIGYVEMMGLSGAAFRLHFHEPNWCPSSPDATCGFNCSVPALKAMGYEFEDRFGPSENPDLVRKTRADIVRSIDHGLPVPAIDLVKVPDWGLIVGYADRGATLLVRDYHADGDGYTVAAKWPWSVLLIKSKGRAPDRRESVIRSLRLAAGLAKTVSFDKYTSGFDAFEHWIAQLNKPELFKGLDEEALATPRQANGWIYHSLIHARRTAAQYLRDAAPMFSEQAAPLLLEAAEHYGQLADRLEATWDHVPRPWLGKAAHPWTPEDRAAQAAALTDALALEHMAVRAIEKALAIIAPPRPA
ncbi:MAG: hypothetical protein BIFFINMI_01723 [Phycisphaerae bacterium]|nr:hypothetical protein [Phycisphaerae bacterium]